jgi:hypothetical protein
MKNTSLIAMTTMLVLLSKQKQKRKHNLHLTKLIRNLTKSLSFSHNLPCFFITKSTMVDFDVEYRPNSNDNNIIVVETHAEEEEKSAP